jgi:LysM repeat protein
MASVLELAKLSSAVYHTDGSALAATVDGWSPEDHHGDPDSGFYAVWFKRKRDQEAVLAIRGTDMTQLSDFGSDAQLAVGSVPRQFYMADEFLTKLRQAMSGRAFYVTGHSLGGGLASLLGAKYRLPTVTLNAPGMRNSLCTVLSSVSPASIAATAMAEQPALTAQQLAARQKAEREINTLDTARMLNLRASGDVVSRGTGPAIGRVEDILVPEGVPSGWAVAASAAMPVVGLYTAGKFALGQHSIDNVCQALTRLPRYQLDLNWIAVPAPPPAAIPPKITATKVHMVAAGDTLAKIAQVYYKDPGRWTVIYAVPSNRAAIGTNPSLIRPGLRLQIPL